MSEWQRNNDCYRASKKSDNGGDGPDKTCAKSSGCIYVSAKLDFDLTSVAEHE